MCGKERLEGACIEALRPPGTFGFEDKEWFEAQLGQNCWSTSDETPQKTISDSCGSRKGNVFATGDTVSRYGEGGVERV